MMGSLFRRLSLTSVCLLLLVVTASTAQARDVPWLAGVTTNSVYVSLEDTGTANVTVDYGLSPSFGSQAFTENYQATDYGYNVHNVKLTSLQANTRYYYRVTNPTTSLVTATYSFYTAPAPGTSARWGFAADCRSGSTTSTTDTTNHNNMAGLIAAQNPRMMVYGGDLCYGSTWPYWNQQWFLSPYNASLTNQINLNATTPWVNAAGNHEGWNALTSAFTQGPNGDGNGYYSFDYGDTHVVIVNNFAPGGDGVGSAQYNWVANDLASSTSKWKVVAFHCPAYSYGSHGGDADMQAMTNNLFETYGVNVVLAGHNHFYEHVYLDGIHHMTIGSFGVGPGGPGTGPGYVYGEQTMCFGIFDTTPTTLTLTTYRQDGTVIETIVVPEPASLVLLAGGLVALLKRRRRTA
jgi:hypothetical protein